jgi:hypothetical protein
MLKSVASTRLLARRCLFLAPTRYYGHYQSSPALHNSGTDECRQATQATLRARQGCSKANYVNSHHLYSTSSSQPLATQPQDMSDADVLIVSVFGITWCAWTTLKLVLLDWCGTRRFSARTLSAREWCQGSHHREAAGRSDRVQRQWPNGKSSPVKIF